MEREDLGFGILRSHPKPSITIHYTKKSLLHQGHYNKIYIVVLIKISHLRVKIIAIVT